MTTYMVIYLGTTLTAMLLVPVVSRLAKKHHLVDNPGPRKVHHVPIPRIGGIAFAVPAVALVVPVFFLNNDVGLSFRETGAELIVLLAASVFVFAVGLIDDLRSLSGRTKLLCLIAASTAICASGATLSSFSIGSWFELETGWAAWPLTVLWITAITVCMNCIDGLDGLAAGIAVIVCGAVAFMAFLIGQAAMAILMLALLGSVTGFLFFNFYPAKIFMGDCGSMFLGFMIGASSVVCQAKTSTLVGLALPFLALGVPILDTSAALVRRRILERRSMFAADRNHLHHRLLDLGFHQRTVVIAVYAVTAISASIGIFMVTADSNWSIGLLVLGLVLLVAVFACAHRKRLCEMVVTLKRNRTIAEQERTVKREFESVEIRMREASSFGAWWETVCRMGQEMQFQSIGLWTRRNGHYKRTRSWSASEAKATRSSIAKLSLPLRGNGAAEREIRVCIWVDKFLEVSGQLVMLLTRLMDEFPPPESQDDGQTSTGQSAQAAVLDSPRDAEAYCQVAGVDATAQRPRGGMPTALNITGIPVVPFETYDHALECVEKTIESRQKSFWVAINPIKIYNAWHQPELRHLLQQTDVGICDGVGVSIASRILNGRGIKRITGCDLFFKLVERASHKQWGVYLLGATAASNAAACSSLRKKYPNLRIVGNRDGFFRDSQEVVEEINRSKADLLFVAMGSPRQEEWIRRHRSMIDASFCMGVGGSLDIASGNLKRAPAFFCATGTEFLFRLAMEPSKRLSHQLVLLSFLAQVIGKKVSGDGESIDGSRPTGRTADSAETVTCGGDPRVGTRARRMWNTEYGEAETSLRFGNQGRG